MPKNLLIIIFVFVFTFLSAQLEDDERIAIQFYQLRDFSKAEILLKKQFAINPEKNYEFLFNTYLQLKKYDEAIDITNKVIKLSSRKNIDYSFKLGYAYYKKNDTLRSKKEWLETNKLITDYENQTLTILSQYIELKQWILAEDIILKFQKKSKNKFSFSTYLIDVLIRLNKFDEVVDYTIELLDNSTFNYMQILSSLNFLNEKNGVFDRLEKKIYTKLNQDPKSDKWNEIAMWASIKAKDYSQALILAKANDKRTNNNSSQVLEIAEVAYDEQEYSVAIKGFEYLKSSSQNHLVKIGYLWKIESMIALYKKTSIKDSAKLIEINNEFNSFFSKYDYNLSSADIQLMYASFHVKYLQNLENAKLILEKLLKFPNLSKQISSRAKLDLADIKLALNDIWEASLLYGQVDKDEKDSPLGEEARFKNSKVFYYNGDYELAEDLLSILKSSTTELIANDALYLALFIQENIDDPALKLAMKDISSAELLFYQNKDIEAFKLLESVKKQYPKSNLIDDILLIEGNYALAHSDYKEAMIKYKELYKNYPTSVIADKALYEYAKLEEEINQNTTIALDSYLLLLTKYKDSVYTTNARKRLRSLRGEKIEEEL